MENAIVVRTSKGIRGFSVGDLVHTTLHPTTIFKIVRIKRRPTECGGERPPIVHIIEAGTTFVSWEYVQNCIHIDE